MIERPAINLQKARAKKQLDRFIEDHPSEGDERRFDELLVGMAGPPQKPEPPKKKAPAK